MNADNQKNSVSVLFVCMGNICRSPLAEGVLRHMASNAGITVHIDSAGTHAYHVGNHPDSRAISAARRRGVDIGQLRARVVERSDFDTFDLVVAMDRDNLTLLEQRCTEQRQRRLRLFMTYAGSPDADVPDPYYGDDTAFEHALDLIERGAKGLLDEIRELG